MLKLRFYVLPLLLFLGSCGTNNVPVAVQCPKCAEPLAILLEPVSEPPSLTQQASDLTKDLEKLKNEYSDSVTKATIAE